MEWKLIDDAAKNGKWVLLYGAEKYGPGVDVARWDAEAKFRRKPSPCWIVRGRGAMRDWFYPTHWRPIPAPPQQATTPKEPK